MTCLQSLKSMPAGIDAWLLEFDFAATQWECDWPLLSVEEQRRAQRFHQPHDQIRFVSTRAALRRLLAERLVTLPNKLCLMTEQYGKPYLPLYPDLQFNLSHAGRFALIAISTQGRIGIDIERRNRDVSGLDAFVLSPMECSLQCWSESRFIDLWVAKEAVLKALGMGIADYLQDISILPNRDGSYRIFHDQSDGRNMAVWQIDAPVHYAAAVAMICKS